MRLFQKLIAVVIIGTLFFETSFQVYPVFAEEASVPTEQEQEIIDRFIDKVESSQEYEKYSDCITELYVQRCADTEVGFRITLSYNTNDGNNVVFVGDGNFNILYSGKIENGDVTYFRSVVESSDVFKENESLIKELEVKRFVETEIGDRITISYTTENENERIVFIGDSNFDIIYAGIVRNNPESVRITDLYEGSSTTLSYTAGASYVDPNCCTFHCTAYQTNIHWGSMPGCSTIVGQPCSSVASIPYFGLVAYVVCKVGVYIACSVYTDKKCTDGMWVNVCEV